MLTFMLSTAVLAKPAAPVVADHTAQALSFGEFMIGTSGLHFGVAPRVQLGTRIIGDAIGLPNVTGRVQILDFPKVDLAVDASWVGSNLEGLSLAGVGGAIQSSVHVGRVSGHLGLRTYRFAMEGIPTAAPRWIVGIAGTDPLADLAQMAAEQGIATAANYQVTNLRAAVETRLFGKAALLVQSSVAFGGQSGVQAQATVEDYTVDVGAGLPGARTLDESTTPGGSWVVSVAWQQQIGPLHVRAGYGASKVPYAWIAQSTAVHLRGGGFKKKERKLDTVAVAEVPE